MTVTWYDNMSGRGILIKSSSGNRHTSPVCGDEGEHTTRPRDGKGISWRWWRVLSGLQEIEILRKELEQTKAALAGCEEVHNATTQQPNY